MIEENSTQHSFVVDPAYAGDRLDHYLVKFCPDLSRSRLKQLITAGKICLNGAAAKPAQILHGGERIDLTIPPQPPLRAVAEAIALDILYEDSELIVLNKNAEMVVHLGAGAKQGTLVNALLHHCTQLSQVGGEARPGIVHRLDKGTSGILVVAKTDRAHRILAAQFQSRQVEKTYLAFVWGKPRIPQGKIELPLGRSERNRKKITTRGRRLREALTRYRTLQSWGAISLLELKPETGRTHQLRVHLTEIGHPIIGDPTYGRDKTKLSRISEACREAALGFKFQLLHAASLTFSHPTEGQRMSFEAPLRTEMANFKKLLEKGV